jgi:hypothetical protein
MGDFNFHVDDSANPRANAFLQLLRDFGLKQHISQRFEHLFYAL